MSHFEDLQKKITSKTAHVGIVGLGYVGLPLAVEFAAAGFTVTGIDIDAKKVAALNRGESYIQDIPTSVLAPLVKSGKLKGTTDFGAVATMDTINICVPTPLRKTKDPDMSYIVNACAEIAKHFHAGVLIILESTTYPGTTNELMLPMFERPGMKVGEDFFLCFRRSAWIPATSEVPDSQHSQSGGRRSRRRAPRSARCSTGRRSKRLSR